MPTQLHQQLRQHLTRLYPGARIVEVEPLEPDSGATASATHKAAGYGVPTRVVLIDGKGKRRELVWRTASSNPFGHDRRADRVAGIVQSFDDFAVSPHHVAAIDLGFVQRDGAILSCRDSDEPYMITTFSPGSIYAGDLRRLAAHRSARALDLARLDMLTRYLVELHQPVRGGDAATRYRRAIRDLVGSGEGIFGIVDGYPDDVLDDRVRRIEAACATWRAKLRGRHDRLTRTHGDFHPFNVVFDGGELTLLDASRGACGDPADDLTAMAINFLLFAIDDPPAWQGLGVLWRKWWADYLAARPDRDLLAVAPPFWAWRTLVVCNPQFYPKLSPAGRGKLLGFAEAVLAAGVLDPARAEELFA
ncbi:MAG TPA: phosphotransferase [Kofleriaceae bacterium]|nr:phosphotransferase [Kofleriaceae bacterium]